MYPFTGSACDELSRVEFNVQRLSVHRISDHYQVDTVPGCKSIKTVDSVFSTHDCLLLTPMQSNLKHHALVQVQRNKGNPERETGNL